MTCGTERITPQLRLGSNLVYHIFALRSWTDPLFPLCDVGLMFHALWACCEYDISYRLKALLAHREGAYRMLMGIAALLAS